MATAPYFGSDTFCLSDVQLIDTLVTDPHVLIGQRLARRLTTPTGGLAVINDDPGGIDLRQYVLKRMGPNEVAALRTDIEHECLKDEEVSSVNADPTLVDGVLNIPMRVISSWGPFAFVLSVSQVNAQVIFSNP